MEGREDRGGLDHGRWESRGEEGDGSGGGDGEDGEQAMRFEMTRYICMSMSICCREGLWSRLSYIISERVYPRACKTRSPIIQTVASHRVEGLRRNQVKLSINLQVLRSIASTLPGQFTSEGKKSHTIPRHRDSSQSSPRLPYRGKTSTFRRCVR